MRSVLSFLSIGILLSACDPGIFEPWNPSSGSVSVSFGSIASTEGGDDFGGSGDWGDTEVSSTSTSTSGTGGPFRCEGEVGEAGGSFNSCQFIHWCGERTFELSCDGGWCTCVQDGQFAGECRMEQQCAAIQSSRGFNPFAPVVTNCCDWGQGDDGSGGSWGTATTTTTSGDPTWPAESGGTWSGTSGFDTTAGEESGPYRPR